MPTLTVLLRHIHGVLLLGGKNLFQKATHQFGRTVESIQIGFHVVPQVVVLVAPTNGLFLGGGKFFFQAADIQLSQIEEGENIVVVSNGKVLLSDPYQFDTIYSIRLQ